MFAVVVFDLVLQYSAKRLAENNISKMTYVVSGASKTLTVSVSLVVF